MATETINYETRTCRECLGKFRIRVRKRPLQRCAECACRQVEREIEAGERPPIGCSIPVIDPELRGLYLPEIDIRGQVRADLNRAQAQAFDDRATAADLEPTTTPKEV